MTTEEQKARVRRAIEEVVDDSDGKRQGRGAVDAFRCPRSHAAARYRSSRAEQVIKLKED